MFLDRTVHYRQLIVADHFTLITHQIAPVIYLLYYYRTATSVLTIIIRANIERT